VTAPPVFVLPFEERLLKGLYGQRLIVRTSRTGDLAAIGEVASHVQCSLEAVILDTDSPVTSLPFEERWKAIPLLVYAPELGRVSHLLQHIPVIRSMSLRFMLPTEGQENYTSLRILSSLGIPSGFVLSGDTADWEELLDLATYYYFNFANHAPIAPLDVLGDQYEPGEGCTFGNAFLEDPSTEYFHLNAAGEVALTAEDLKKGEKVYPSLEALREAGSQEELEGKSRFWSRLFLSPGPCTTCPAMKLCRGRVAGDDGKVPDGCSSFFSELMGMIEEYQAMRGGRGN
jgi:hypothetical protein